MGLGAPLARRRASGGQVRAGGGSRRRGGRVRGRGLAIRGLVAGMPPPPCGRKRGDSHAKRSDRGEALSWNTLSSGTGRYFRSKPPVTQAHIHH